jgi:hypothetical protein
VHKLAVFDCGSYATKLMIGGSIEHKPIEELSVMRAVSGEWSVCVGLTPRVA